MHRIQMVSEDRLASHLIDVEVYLVAMPGASDRIGNRQTRGADSQEPQASSDPGGTVSTSGNWSGFKPRPAINHAASGHLRTLAVAISAFPCGSGRDPSHEPRGMASDRAGVAGPSSARSTVPGEPDESGSGLRLSRRSVQNLDQVL